MITQNTHTDMKAKLKTLIERINHDIKSAEMRNESYNVSDDGYKFNHAQIITLKTVLFDMRELRLTDED